MRPSALVDMLAGTWSELERSKPQPTRLRNVKVANYRDLAELTLCSPLSQRVVDDLYAGDVYILKGAFNRRFLQAMQMAVKDFFQATPSSFHKMTEGTPDFHRIITPEEGQKYSFPCCKHSAYFYRFNGDPLGIMPAIYDRWRVMKMLMGLDPLTYELNTPKDGVVDRVQVVRYPPAIGFLAPHSDPWKHQRIFVSTYMSKRGVDYNGGGFYAVGAAGPQNIEDEVDVGDIGIGYATVHHGVAACDGQSDWSKSDGRWFLSTYSNASDEVKDRHTGYGVGTAA